jgi:3-hydroxybutyrate dehydrogenase
MSDSDDGSMDLTPPETTPADVLRVPDDRFGPENAALVTGAASGIGRATALALAVNGLTVAATDLDEDGLTETCERAAAADADGAVEPLVGDLTDAEDVRRVVDEAAALGDLRFVANVAGVQHIAPIAEFPVEKWDLLTDVMLRAPFLVTKYATPHVHEAGGGAIANMSSVHGHYATRDKPAYVAAKHGLHGLTRATAAEGDGDLRAFTVSVGYVLTPLMADQIADQAGERGISEREVVEDVFLGQARTKELMTPAQVANLFVFGLSEHGRHLNGGDMLWDGGYTHTYE